MQRVLGGKWGLEPIAKQRRYLYPAQTCEELCRAPPWPSKYDNTTKTEEHSKYALMVTDYSLSLHLDTQLK